MKGKDFPGLEAIIFLRVAHARSLTVSLSMSQILQGKQTQNPALEDIYNELYL